MNPSDFDDVRWDDYSNSTPQQEHTASDENDFEPSPQQSAFHNGHDTNTQLHEQQDTPQPMSIIINDPLKVDNSHVAYLVKTTTTLESFSSSEPKPVRRRFQEFVWLHDALAAEYPACIIPRLPNKHRMCMEKDKKKKLWKKREKKGKKGRNVKKKKHSYRALNAANFVLLPGCSVL
ncbi:Phox homologous domain-containing protein [Gongronella butleri]|nr:Phox homologous domain-containing protein [Gongronella butleri]